MTWEQLEDFVATYPTVQLEDELFVGEEGNVVDSFVGHAYRCRKKREPAAPAAKATTKSG